jgi:hypothetical protein
MYTNFHLYTTALEFGLAGVTNKESQRGIESSVPAYIAVSKTKRKAKWQTNTSSGGTLPHEQPHELE